MHIHHLLLLVVASRNTQDQGTCKQPTNVVLELWVEVIQDLAVGRLHSLNNQGKMLIPTSTNTFSLLVHDEIKYNHNLPCCTSRPGGNMCVEFWCFL
jgi:hypothetical protein